MLSVESLSVDLSIQFPSVDTSDHILSTQISVRRLFVRLFSRQSLVGARKLLVLHTHNFSAPAQIEIENLLASDPKTLSTAANCWGWVVGMDSP